MRRVLVLILKCAVVGILASYLVASLGKIDFGKLATVHRGAGWVALAQAFLLGSIVFSVWRWQLLLRVQDIHYRFRQALSLALIGYFFNLFIPGPTGGDLVRACYVAMDHPEKRTSGITAVFLDRVVGVFVLVLLSGGAICFNWTLLRGDAILRHLAAVVALTLVMAVAGCMLFSSARIRSQPAVRALFSRLPFRGILGKVLDAVDLYRREPALVLQAVLLSTAAQLSNIGTAIALATALGGGVDAMRFFFVVPLASLAMAVPIGAPGGLGQMESAYQALLEHAGYGDGLLVAILIRLSWCVWSLVGGIVYLARRVEVKAAMERARQDAGVRPPEAPCRSA